MIKFNDGSDLFELDLAMQEEGDLPSRGDAYVTIRVQSKGFAGSNDLWVEAAALQAFCEGLIELERTRRGEARLCGMSPGELDLRIFNIDAPGHMAVEGSTGYQVQRSHRIFPHAVQFGFEFDPSQLAEAAQEGWVRRNAEPRPPCGTSLRSVP